MASFDFLPLLIMGGVVIGGYLLWTQYSKSAVPHPAEAMTPVPVVSTPVPATAAPVVTTTLADKKATNALVASALIRSLNGQLLAESFDLRNTINNLQRDIARKNVTDADIAHLRGLICSTEYCRRNKNASGCRECYNFGTSFKSNFGFMSFF